MPRQRLKETDIGSAASRVALRPVREGDLGALAPWYEVSEQLHFVGRGPGLDRGRAGALPYGTGVQVAGEPTGGLLAITRCSDDAPIGLLDYRVGVPEEGWLGFGLVGVERGLRGLGLDSEAVRLVEEDTLERGLARRFWAAVHRDNGLGFYFWLRLGHRPARPGESPWPENRPRDIISMIRIPQDAGT